MHRKLYIRPARLNTDGPHNLQRCVPHYLVFLIRQRLRRRYRYTVARMNPHRIEILNRTNNNHIIFYVAHYLQLVFLPADEGFLDQDLVLWAEVQAPPDVPLVLSHIVRDVAAGPAERIARPYNGREPYELDYLFRLVPRMGVAAAWHLEAALFHSLFELVSLLGLFDALKICTNHFDAVLFQYAALGQGNGGIKAGLAA